MIVIVLSNLIGLAKDYRQRLLNVRVMLSLRRTLFERLLHLPLRGDGPGDHRFRDLPALLRAADVFCFPSHLEGLGTSVLDALAMLCPVVSTTAGGIPEMIVDADTGLLVPPASPRDLSAAVIRLLDRPLQATAMGRAGRRLARDRFSIEARAADLVEQYRHLATGRRPA